MSVQSLTGMAEDRLLHILRQSLSANARTATFACGGNVYFRGQRVSEDSTKCNEIEPIQVRFGESGKGVKVLFPLDGSGPDSELDQLISACQPATFGRGGENVMDESYRKAGKLDESDFATSFCPYTAGIVDIISQLLLPQLNHDKSTRSIKAELYKLNVYGAPSGKFKAHVDTPRSERQIGSLVVALPVDHEGGQLAVRSAFKELLFDWSTSGNISEDGTEDRPCIKWAAFYSDCEHEVYEVTAGNRITLTYNLYITRGAGHLAGHTAALDPAQLPLYNVLDNALQAAAFLTQGRVLAIYLTHSYAHTHKSLNFLPESLKGADWSLWETVRALGLKCELVAVHSHTDGWDRTRYYVDSSLPAFYEGPSLPFEDEYDGGEAMPMHKITWLNGHCADDEHKEAQTAYLAYGNQAELDVKYSRAAMLIRVPPFRLRGAENAEAKSVYADVKRDSRKEQELAGNEYSDEGSMNEGSGSYDEPHP